MSVDPPEAPTPQVAWLSYSTRRGRPRVVIDPRWLAMALELRGPGGIAPTISTSSKTVRRRALELGLVQPGEPVIQNITQPDGSVERVHTSTSAPVSTLSDDDLDAMIYSVLEIFPTFGRRMINGYLRSQGHRVPMDRIRSSYLRVHGAPGAFGDRQIARKEYKVPGPLSLAHMDGQHGE